MKGSVRIGVVGAGYLGSIHAEIFSRLSNVKLVGVADINPIVGQAVANQYGAAFMNDGRELINKVDAVTVAVPTSSHREVSESFLAAAIPVMLENPIAHTIQDAESIVKVAELNRCLLQIGHQERFNAGVIRLHEELKGPRFIEVHRLGQFVERATDVDVVTDLMIHDIDIVLSLVEAELSYVSAVGAKIVTDHVDIANARLEFSDGAIANVTASRVSAKKFRRIRTFSDTGYLGLNFEDQQIDVARPGHRPPGGGFAQIMSDTIRVEPTSPLDAELVHFVDCVRRGNTPLVTGAVGLRALRVAHQVREKIEHSLYTVS